MKQLHFLSFFSAFLCISLSFSAFSFYFLRPKKELLVDATGENDRVIIIDAGHGGMDGGASGPDGTL